MERNYCVINGNRFDATVAISGYEQNFNVLDGPNVGRVMSGQMIRDIIGTYLGHKITFISWGCAAGAFDALWDYLVQHSSDDCVMLSAADNQTAISYEAYYTSGRRKLKTVDNGTNVWDEIEVNFIPMDARVRPAGTTARSRSELILPPKMTEEANSGLILPPSPT